MTGIFLQLSRVLPNEYPPRGSVQSYLRAELGFGRLLDYGVIVPRLQQLYQWSAHELAAPGLLDCARDGALDLRLVVRGPRRLAAAEIVPPPDDPAGTPPEQRAR